MSTLPQETLRAIAKLVVGPSGDPEDVLGNPVMVELLTLDAEANEKGIGSYERHEIVTAITRFMLHAPKGKELDAADYVAKIVPLLRSILFGVPKEL